MTTANSSRLLDETRRVIEEARAVVGGGPASRTGDHDSQDGDPAAHDGDPAAGILELYEALCRRLDQVDADRLRALLARIAEHIEELNGLGDEIESVRRLHAGLRED